VAVTATVPGKRGGPEGTYGRTWMIVAWLALGMVLVVVIVLIALGSQVPMIG
jgi:hypothetical protein